MPRTERYVERTYTKPELRPENEPGVMTIEMLASGQPHACHFMCPCGCGDNIRLDLVRDGWSRADAQAQGRHVWEYHHSGNMINPSVDCKVGCRSHFTVKQDGLVQWH